MRDCSEIVKSVLSSRLYHSNSEIELNIPLHAMKITFLDVVYAIILIEKSLNIDLIKLINNDEILNYTVSDIITIIGTTNKS